MSIGYTNFVNQNTITINGLFRNLFSGDTGVINAQNLVLPATTLSNDCYRGMFYSATSLLTAPAQLPATVMKDSCYQAMFYRTQITECPDLPATTLAMSCYMGMFSTTPITQAPILSATTLARACYRQMFENCTGLTTAPELPATILVDGCYDQLFSYCTNLSRVVCLAEDISATDCINSWLRGVSSTGTFVKSANMNDWPSGGSGIPNNWTVQNA